MHHINKMLISIVALGLASVSHANLLVNGDFEQEPNYGINGNGGYSYLTGNQLPGWTIETGHYVTIHNTSMYPTISGNYSLNTDGEGMNGVNADLYQDFATVSGQLYHLDYDWKGWQQSYGTLDVRVTNSAGDTLYDDQHDWDNMGVHHQTLDFFGDGGLCRVRIFDNPETGINDNQMIVDNFNVSAVPEPASIFFLAGSALAVLRRRKS